MDRARTSRHLEERCAVENCMLSGEHKVTCYVCEQFYHTGCLGIPDLNYKVFRCFVCFDKKTEQEPPPPKSKRNRYKVSCNDCNKTFTYYDETNSKVEQFLCIRCFTQRSSSEENQSESPQPNTSKATKKRRNKIFCRVCNRGFSFSNMKDRDFEKFICFKCYMNHTSSDSSTSDLSDMS